MKGRTEIIALYARHQALAGLPRSVRIPDLREGGDEIVKPVGMATVDDLVFALFLLNERASSFYREIDALQTLHDEARKVGAYGTDIAMEVLIATLVKERKGR